MCDFSLQHAKSRPAQVADKLITKNFGRGTTGFAAVNDPDTAVCLLPGTEIAFDDQPESRGIFSLLPWRAKHKVAIFRQVRKDEPHAHHDAMEFPDGEIRLLTSLTEGRTATVLQLPAKPQTKQEELDQTRAVFAG
jgi:hypothetical protein